MITVQVQTKQENYPIVFGKELPTVTNPVIVTDSTVGPIHASPIAESLKAKMITFPSGEKYKTREIKQHVEDELLKEGYGRDTTLIAVGGGVVTDLVGFVAATYCRGIPCVLVPTTLLAMVDACIGGKTGVNTLEGKNLIGAIHQPQAIIIDISVLETLPDELYRNGFAEIVKHALIADSKVFAWLEGHVDDLSEREPQLLQQCIYDSCTIKKTVIEKDVLEKGLRKILNFGHTFGHAIETVMNYTISHGEAVAAGMAIEAQYSVKSGGLNSSEYARIINLLEKFGFDLSVADNLSKRDLLEVMIHDKKSIDRIPRIVMLKEIGVPYSFNGNYCDVFSLKDE